MDSSFGVNDVALDGVECLGNQHACIMHFQTRLGVRVEAHGTFFQEVNQIPLRVKSRNGDL